jgi:hypothetical protein
MTTGLLFAMFVLAGPPAQVPENPARPAETAQAPVSDAREERFVSCACQRPRDGNPREQAPGPNENLDLGETAKWPAY